MEKVTIEARELPVVLTNLIGISKKGKVNPFSEWLKIEESVISLRKTAKDEEQILNKIKEDTGFETYSKKAQELYLKDPESYLEHSDDEIKAIESYKEKEKEFFDRKITIMVNKIPQKVIESIHKDAYEYRTGLLPIIDLAKKSKKGDKQDAE